MENNVSELKNKLIDNKIYVATYWNDAIGRVNNNSIEFKLINNTVYIPIDQRYDIKDMEYIINIISTFIGIHGDK